MADGAPVDREFLEGVIATADLNALRIALYQETGDEELAAMDVVNVPVWGGVYNVAALAPQHHEALKQKALAYLENPPPRKAAPSRAEARRLMKLLTGEPVSDARADWGYDELAYEPLPRGVEWRETPDAATVAQTRVLVVGAGLSGISIAKRLDHLGIPYDIVDRQSDIGGTWALNRYPGARVDVPSTNYQFKFEKNYPWKHFFSTQQENQEYIRYCARKHGILEHISFETLLVSADWIEADKLWRVVLETGGNRSVRDYRVIVSGAGLFSKPKDLGIPGLADFKGKFVTTTDWDIDDAQGARIALIGNGSSGAQTMPQLAKIAKSLTVFQRTPQWMMGFDGYFAEVPEGSHWLFSNMPNYWNWYGYSGFHPATGLRDMFAYDREWQKQGGVISEKNDRLRDVMVAYMEEKLAGRPDLIEKSLPDYPPWGRRLVIDSGWYESLLRANVELVTDGIERFTANGILAGGVEHELDVIVSAAGFETADYLWPVDYRGRDGATLRDLWSVDGPRAHLGLVVPGMPNFFMLYGAPNSQPMGGTMASWIEIWSRYIVQLIATMIEDDIPAVECRRDVYDDYNRRLDETMSELLFEEHSKGCYFINEYGRCQTQTPWNVDEYYMMVREPDLDDYVIG